jgi:hypothetical protein
MKINRPGSPLSSGAEPLEPTDPQELKQAVNRERFAAALSNLEAQVGAGDDPAAAHPVRAALAEIARHANLASSEGAATAVRESARFMIRLRLREKFRDSEQAESLVEGLAEFVAADPLLNPKLLSILQKLKAA